MQPRFAFVLLAAALLPSCETSSTVSTGPNPVKCVVSLGAAPTMDAGGGAGSLAITTQPECAWDVSTNVNWISALAPATGQGPANVSFRVAANEGSSSREGLISVNGQQARVAQRAPCRYEVAPANQSISSSGGAASVTISTAAECAWTASSDANWISLASPATGSGNATLALTIARNDSIERTGAISVANQRASVTQASGVSPPPPLPPAPQPPPPPPACNYLLSRTSDNVAFNDGAGIVSVSTTSACRWTAASNAAWLHVSAVSTTSGAGSVEYRYTVNFGPPRTGTLTIAGLTYTVNQGSISSQLPSSSSR